MWSLGRPEGPRDRGKEEGSGRSGLLTSASRGRGTDAHQRDGGAPGGRSYAGKDGPGKAPCCPTSVNKLTWMKTERSGSDVGLQKSTGNTRVSLTHVPDRSPGGKQTFRPKTGRGPEGAPSPKRTCRRHRHHWPSEPHKAPPHPSERLPSLRPPPSAGRARGRGSPRDRRWEGRWRSRCGKLDFPQKINSDPPMTRQVHTHLRSEQTTQIQEKNTPLFPAARAAAQGPVGGEWTDGLRRIRRGRPSPRRRPLPQ